jgi:hypothetical protein
METISKTERTTVTILAKIAGVDVNINYDRTTGQQPQSINAGCSIVPPVAPVVEGVTPAPVEAPAYINITRQGNGQTSVSVNGNKDITKVAALIESIKAELEIIATEGVTV